MGPEWVAILALVALFVVGTVLPINMGALAYVAAWLVGMFSLDLDDSPGLLAGDVLFAGSVGRVDLPGGSWESMLRSLRDVVLPLDDATVVLPGHGPATTIGRERATNPYLAEAASGVGEAPRGRGL